MPVFHITAPDGSTHEITAPEGATEQDALQYAQSQLSQPAAQPQPTQPSAPPSILDHVDAAIDNFAQGATFGYADEISAGIGHALGQGDYDTLVARNRAADKSTSDRMPVTSAVSKMLGMVASPINKAIGAGVGMVRGAGYVNSALQGAAMGGISGAGDSTEGNRLSGAAVGAGFGAAGGTVAEGLANAISPTVSASVQKLIDEGVQPTFGQSIGPKAARLEEKLSSVPGLGDLIKDSQRNAIESFNRAAYNRVLDPLGKTYDGPVGHTAVRKIGDTLSQAYDDIMPHLQFAPDAQLQADLTAASAAKATMSNDAAEQFDKIVKNALPKGPTAGEDLKDLESQLTFEIGRFGKSPNPNDQKISDALSEVRTAIMDNLARANPDVADSIKAIDTGWANLVRVERAANSGKGGVFTPEGLAVAVKAADQSVRKRAVARGTALMQDLTEPGTEVLGKAYPDSGTAGRALIAGGALGFLNPKALALGAAASIPYLPGVRNLGLATLRPSWAPQAANLLGGAAPGAAGGAALRNYLGP